METTAAHARVAGLSPFVTLGDFVLVGEEAPYQRAEVIRLDGEGMTIKPYASQLAVRLGAPVWRGGRIDIAPHESPSPWQGCDA